MSRHGTPMYRARQDACMFVTVEHPDGEVEVVKWCGRNAAAIKKVAKEHYVGAKLSFGRVFYVTR